MTSLDSIFNDTVSRMISQQRHRSFLVQQSDLVFEHARDFVGYFANDASDNVTRRSCQDVWIGDPLLSNALNIEEQGRRNRKDVLREVSSSRGWSQVNRYGM